MTDMEKDITILENLDSLLNSRGFKAEYYNFLDNEMTGLDYLDTLGRHIELVVSYSEEYYEYLKTNIPEGTEYEPDFSRINVREVRFDCVINYPESIDSKTFLRISDIAGTFPLYFSRAYDAFMNPELYSIEIQEIHRSWVKKFSEKCKSVLEKFDYKSIYDSYWDIGGDSPRYNSCPLFVYEFDSIDFINFTTDILTQKFMMDTVEVDFDNFEEQFIETNLKNSETGLIKLKFEYLFSKDPKFTRKSYSNILYLMESIKNRRRNPKIDFNFIPEKYKDLVLDYEKNIF